MTVQTLSAELWLFDVFMFILPGFCVCVCVLIEFGWALYVGVLFDVLAGGFHGSNDILYDVLLD